MASSAIALHLRPNRHRLLQNPTFVHFFSSSSSPDPPNPEDQTSTDPSSSPSQSQPQSSFTSYFNDVKASLKQSSLSSQQRRQQPRKPFSLSSEAQAPSKVASFEEIRKNLSEYRRRSTVPPPSTSRSQTPTLSFQELYKRNVMAKGDPGSSNVATKTGLLSLDTIRESLKEMRPQNQSQVPNNNFSLDRLKESLKLRPPNANENGPSAAIGSWEKLPELFEKDKKPADSNAMKTEFVKTYSYKDLGDKLMKLRPEMKGKNWFTLGELNERLVKLREVEEKETESRIGGTFKYLRESLIQMQTSDADKAKKTAIQRLNVLGLLGGTPNFMLSPPKENLVEKYFHPDNMSSSEKLKLELRNVRDEFKMSESDCGSARVQVAQLTTKIKHLSTALHKKDTHSRKGLQAMVQQRKKLLKYLRRTDWDSYCLVLSRLGLRDNPDYKN